MQQSRALWYLARGALKLAKDLRANDFDSNNCGDAFKRAINKMGIPGLPKENAVKPSSHQWFIENVLVPRGNVVATDRF